MALTNWCLVARDALLEHKPELAESIARAYGVGKRVDTSCIILPSTGVLVDVRTFLGRDGQWYMSVWVALDCREDWIRPLSTAPNGQESSFCGGLCHIYEID